MPQTGRGVPVPKLMRGGGFYKGTAVFFRARERCPPTPSSGADEICGLNNLASNVRDVGVTILARVNISRDLKNV